VDYTLWVPGEEGDSFETGQNAVEEQETGQDVMTDGNVAEYLPPKPFQRSDFVTLVQKKGNWRISEIRRVSAD
jgi:hypothetical protein